MKMEITIEWKMTQYPTFKVMLHGTAGADPFLTIHDCRIVSGSKGDFVSYPARKDNNNKYWNYVQGGEKFNAAVLQKAQEARPRQAAKPAAKSQRDDDLDPPF